MIEETATATQDGPAATSENTDDGAVAGERADPELPEGQSGGLSEERAARRAAALAHVRTFGDPALKTRARTVEAFDDALRAEVARMGALMDDAIGIGLAATQLGVLHRVLVYRVGSDAPLAALINPEVEWSGDEQELMEEGCLSLPGIHVDVERPIHVRVRARDELGEDLVVEATGLEARVIQHEIDHLDGVLILDRASREERKRAMRELRERSTV